MTAQKHQQVEETPPAGAWLPYEDGGNDPDFYIPAPRPGHFSLGATLRTWFVRPAATRRNPTDCPNPRDPRRS